MKAEIKNLKKVAQRILEAIKNKEKIIIYGDSDPDGVGSVIILEETIKELGFKSPKIYFPDREKEGYGLNEKALKCLKKYSPALLITLDCGIGNISEVETAKKMGFEVIIIDHHKVLSQVPKASIICAPKQKGDKYPFKELANAGLTYKLSKLLFSLANQHFNPERFLEIVVLATISDMMIIEADNEKFIKEGSLALNFTQRPGLIALIDITKFENWDSQEIRQKLVSILNAGQTIKHLNEAYVLLSEKNLTKAKNMVQLLVKKSEYRRQEIKKIFEEIEKRIDNSDLIVFDGDANWPLILLGPSASRACNKYGKPVFLFHKGDKECPGAVRMPSGVDAVKAMTSCEDLLKTYGGHALAAGFRIETKNLENFKNCLIKYFKR
ncbi:MAG: DHH family phosphoesterase [Patescibacteria group bacterium]|nr:DHH family phosphoesterase [Patescibacteria group bacterium]MBU1877053.1 DHH family phosphoesterase [Patescibacteria group bacterium]